jgi:hypothetical protein
VEKWSRFLRLIHELKQVSLTFGGTELSALKRRPHEQDKNAIGRLLYDHLSAALGETARPSLLRNIYDALSIKPGIFGVSLDVKALLEATFPEFKDSLNRVRLKRHDFARLQIFVSPDGTKKVVPIPHARKELGEELFERLLQHSIIQVTGPKGEDSVVVVHDLVAGIIGMYSP